MSEINVEIKDLPKSDTIGVFGVGPYAVAIKQSCGELFKFVGQNNINHGSFIAASVSVSSEQLAAIKLTGDEPVKHISWEEGTYAVFTHKGPYENLSKTYDYFFKNWLPTSSRIPSESPSVEVYLNDSQKVSPADLITEIYIKLQPTTN
ncbi:hypothetical protein PPL_10898 [Heterostelium album PN500]|uniref:AraC effector-binding domain-containing protein n=1 Tax=Heterostelium pallidum (strain ATCC 26659 / Pp 5 / PN500) TaxID=670386 RepID=D3BSA6_HETP5|nr:hypothetical protein PPL_10898 [Heterostelium album PN500]EFA75843.1 hypothetical protein PPL_10898 [Heterostelium album PN500]|eukprot:XP_020427977.1 hypothetical protein PPL_10898 [Heterostelium album PN500]